MREKRGPWYLLTGLLIGFTLGLIYAWAIQPVEYIDTAPSSLRADFKDQYRAVIAAAYLANSDLVRARARLVLLGDEDTFRAVAEQAQRQLAEGDKVEEARALGILAIDMGQGVPGAALTRTPQATSGIPSQASPQPALLSTDAPPTGSTAQPTTNNTPTASPFPTSMPVSPTITQTGFSLVRQEEVCTSPLQAPLIIVDVKDAAGTPLAGVLIIVTWDSGEERFYTGLKPEKGMGYADFTLTAGLVYTLRLGESGTPVYGLSAVECQDAQGNRYWGAWILEFVQL